MNKAANTYWDSRRETSAPRRITRKAPAQPAKAARRTAPWWLSMLIVGSISAMLCVSINLRAMATMNDEVETNSRLSGEIQNLMDENLALQEEIHMLRTNPTAIEREARKIGIYLKQQ